MSVEVDIAPAGDAGSRLDGRVAIVTGAGTSGALPGTGVAIAVLFANQGAHVGVVDISAERAANTVELIESIGGSCQPVVADITHAENCELAVNQVVERFGGLDILVNNAA